MDAMIRWNNGKYTGGSRPLARRTSTYTCTVRTRVRTPIAEVEDAPFYNSEGFLGWARATPSFFAHRSLVWLFAGAPFRFVVVQAPYIANSIKHSKIINMRVTH